MGFNPSCCVEVDSRKPLCFSYTYSENQATYGSIEFRPVLIIHLRSHNLTYLKNRIEYLLLYFLAYWLKNKSHSFLYSFSFKRHFRLRCHSYLQVDRVFTRAEKYGLIQNPKVHKNFYSQDKGGAIVELKSTRIFTIFKIFQKCILKIERLRTYLYRIVTKSCVH